jgi:hypothetical protein
LTEGHEQASRAASKGERGASTPAASGKDPFELAPGLETPAPQLVKTAITRAAKAMAIALLELIIDLQASRIGVYH